MTDTDRLRDLLEQAAPTAPDLAAPERATVVARRGRASRRRDRVLVAGAALCLVVAAVAIPALRSADTRPEPAAAPVSVAACEPLPVAPALPDLGGDLALTAVRTCAAGHGGQTAVAPDGPLTGPFVVAFLEDVRAAVSDVPTVCPLIYSAVPHVLQMQVDSGAVYQIRVTNPCTQTVQVDDRFVRVSDVLAAYSGNLQRQHSGVQDLACPQGAATGDTWNASFDPSTATAGIVCQTNVGVEARDSRNIEGHLDPDQLAAVRTSLARPPVAQIGIDFDFDCANPAQQVVVLADSDGDQAAWEGNGCSNSGTLTSIRGSWRLDLLTQNALHNALIAGGLR